MQIAPKKRWRSQQEGSAKARGTHLDPRVSEELVDSVALFRIDIEEMSDEILGCEERKVDQYGVRCRETTGSSQEAEMSSHHGERKV